MLKLTFIILHYQNMKDTINCIESIKELHGANSFEISIIIVDNKSPNDSGNIIKEKYINDDKVNILLLDKNYGFSKGNNIAYKKALENSPDVILILNNDIIFEDKEFLNELNKIYKLPTKYDIVCPDILDKNNNHQNPLRQNEMSLKKAYKNMIYEIIFFVLINIPIIRIIVSSIRQKREEKWFNQYYAKKNSINTNDFVPFGAFIIYMNNWLKNEDKAFVSDTFMYEEEDMLSLYIRKNSYKILYAKELIVRHLEGQSTNISNKSNYKQLKFKSKHKANAIKKYIKYYKRIIKEEKNF